MFLLKAKSQSHTQRDTNWDSFSGMTNLTKLKQVSGSDWRKGGYFKMKTFIIGCRIFIYMVCKGIMSKLNSTLFDCYVRNPTQKAPPFSCDYLRNQIKSRLIMTYNNI